ncbi:tripartite tricarboxylate transporter TctB family protein [Celeribacter halophilus]|jgi:hypothetical protein|uniref:tripartite tricarboxylate transporter TctB family protein n=1 Tax=Celeribacter halophilus TaxID=576117 RepID=UPI002FD57361
MKLTDALLGGFFILFGGVMLWMASQFPSFQGQPYGASFLPSILAVGFMLSGGLLVLRDVRVRRLPAPDGVSRPIFAFVSDLKNGGTPALLAVLGNILAQIFLAPSIGFLPVSLVGLCVLFLLLRLSFVKSFILALAVTLVCWWMFAGLLRVPLPRGLLEGVL